MCCAAAAVAAPTAASAVAFFNFVIALCICLFISLGIAFGHCWFYAVKIERSAFDKEYSECVLCVMCTYPYHVKHSMKMPTSTQNMSTNIFPYSPFKRHKNSRYFNQQLICSFFIFIVFHFGDTFAIHERKYIVLPFASRIVPAWKPFYPMDDPINIPTFNIFAFAAKCFIPFFAFYTHAPHTWF